MAGRSLIDRLLDEHRAEGSSKAGEEIAITIDQVLLQDATGAMAFLQFEAMELERVRPRVVVAYSDHQTLQSDSRHTDDHRFIESACARYGAWYARPGSGICHVVHLERFSRPGESILGSDSHTPHLGCVGMLALGAGGIDVAIAMGGGPYVLKRPSVTRVRLDGRLRPWSTAKDVIMELLRRLSVKGGIGRAFEYVGPGLESLSVPERATIANMGTELGLTLSVFPSDLVTRDYFRRLGRPGEWRPLAADVDARYEDELVVDLDSIEPLVAKPSQPDAIVPVGELAGTEIDQVMVGSCTNGSFHDLAAVARIVEGRRVHPRITFVVFPGSQGVLADLARGPHLAALISAGAIVSESSCGACPGYVHVPAEGTRSLRAFNRNFKGRSGLRDDQVYLSSPEVAAVSALTGTISDPRGSGLDAPAAELSSGLPDDPGLLVPPPDTGVRAELLKGPNIAEVPLGEAHSGSLEAVVSIKLGDKVSTDDITPAGAAAITFRTNVPKLAEFVFKRLDPGFVERARAAGRSIVVAGEAYGQGSSREHAAIAPMYLGVRAVLAKSFARIHQANLVNWGILPLRFADAADYEDVEEGDRLRLQGVESAQNTRSGRTYALEAELSEREQRIVLAGGLLAQTKSNAAAN